MNVKPSISSGRLMQIQGVTDVAGQPQTLDGKSVFGIFVRKVVIASKRMLFSTLCQLFEVSMYFTAPTSCVVTLITIICFDKDIEKYAKEGEARYEAGTIVIRTDLVK